MNSLFDGKAFILKPCKTFQASLIRDIHAAHEIRDLSVVNLKTANTRRKKAAPSIGGTQARLP
ncbi:hypothetical protein [Asticcacaulis sp.]|uniref:hypothetical protein n=1 Tax=Asticcacaulis sp. TaxID=1872648 RepID=UPI003F7C574F